MGDKVEYYFWPQIILVVAYLQNIFWTVKEKFQSINIPMQKRPICMQLMKVKCETFLL